ncbi:helix-turn-helix domain-containing protein [Saccharopolyspora elongata]|uniref:Helix-turn-helix domain-containing protein n=1 Tax=Saccharopolyspora elongata TaxID=2530387 RepID=A0A4R4Z0N4_9PSEU|nr:helix-turn-helix transcriptional regulator [Saccharopolyspora elongata]TDD51373.1 helix-turn-helix domain-containing protein [Saccharopolyspora elongata]
MAPSSPTVANWALGLRLKEKREEAGLSGIAAAKHIGITGAYLSEVEKGKKNLSSDRMNAVIDSYEFSEEEADELRALRDDASQRGWWNSYSAIFNDELLRFFGYEHGAESLHTYDSGLMNGLLQTEDYARAVIESGSPNVRLAEAERRIKARLTRQRRLRGEDPLRITAVMSEAVLRQQVGGAAVLKAQLEHLADLVDELPDSLEVLVVPFEATGHHAMGGSAFHIMTFPSGRLPTLLWQETVTSTNLITDSLTVREYALAHAEAEKAALSREDSLQLIRSIFRSL